MSKNTWAAVTIGIACPNAGKKAECLCSNYRHEALPPVPLQSLFPHGVKCPASWVDIPLTRAQAPRLTVERFGCGNCGLQFCSIPELWHRDQGNPKFFSMCEMKHVDGDKEQDFLRGGVFAMNNSTNQVAFAPSSWQGHGDGAANFSAHFQVACVMGWQSVSMFEPCSLEALHVGRMVVEASLEAEVPKSLLTAIDAKWDWDALIPIPKSFRKTIGKILVVKNFRKGVAEGLAEIKEKDRVASAWRGICGESLPAESVWGGSVKFEEGEYKVKWNSGTLQGSYHFGVATPLEDDQKDKVKGADEKQAPNARKQIVEAALKDKGYGVSFMDAVVLDDGRVMPCVLEAWCGRVVDDPFAP